MQLHEMMHYYKVKDIQHCKRCVGFSLFCVYLFESAPSRISMMLPLSPFIHVLGASSHGSPPHPHSYALLFSLIYITKVLAVFETLPSCIVPALHTRNLFSEDQL